MRTSNSRLYDQYEDDFEMNSIIYLSDHQQKTPSRKDTHKDDVFWNVVFTALCLSVLAVLFLH